MVNKEERILVLFLNEPSKHWHFEKILKAAGVSRSNGFKWLSKLVQEGILTYVKEEGKMPYYVGNVQNPVYQNKKKVYALEKFQQTGFLDHLATLRAKVVILFGSFSRWDWYKDSDIDVFIYGDDDDFEVGKYETLLKREIQVFTAKNEQDLQRFGIGLLKNIINGYRIKGRIDDVLQVSLNAQT